MYFYELNQFALQAGDEYYGDGCNWKCTVETGWTCPAIGACTKACGTNFDFYLFPCEDGNLVNGDGCSSTCQIEYGFNCYGGDPMAYDSCYEICGDGKLLGLSVWCDDGNNESGDGCSSICHVERGWTCGGGNMITADTCTEICGDGVDLHFYECDDGNNEDGDGCDASCVIEAGYTCIGGDNYNADVCDERCGDGVTVLYVAGKCDDGNVFIGDGCSSTCDVETGWLCSGGGLTAADDCWEVCGDGMNAGGLECDDSNVFNGDGCDENCAIETGFNCTGGSLIQDDTCLEICGDGLNYGRYECDDANLDNNDGCDEYCNIEPGWFCYGGTTLIRDYCKQYPKPIVTNITVDAANSLVTIRFNETIILDPSWNDTQIDAYIEGPKTPYIMDFTAKGTDFLMKQASDTLELNITVSDQLYEGVNQVIYMSIQVTLLQTLVVVFVNQSSYTSDTTTRPLYNYTIGVRLNTKADLSNTCTPSLLTYQSATTTTTGTS